MKPEREIIADLKKRMLEDARSAEIPSQFTHSIKLEETAKGIRISVHVYANDRTDAITDALETYEQMKGMLEDHGHPLAPMEVNSKKNEKE